MCEPLVMDCIFCRIAEGSAESFRVFESDACVAFLDTSPVARGHTLVIPRAHSSSVLRMGSEESAALFQTVQLVADAIVNALHADGFNLGANTGKCAGQTVNHAHIHVIPRFFGDQFWCTRHPQTMPNGLNGIDTNELAQISEQIRIQLGSHRSPSRDAASEQQGLLTTGSSSSIRLARL